MEDGKSTPQGICAVERYKVQSSHRFLPQLKCQTKKWKQIKVLRYGMQPNPPARSFPKRGITGNGICSAVCVVRACLKVYCVPRKSRLARGIKNKVKNQRTKERLVRNGKKERREGGESRATHGPGNGDLGEIRTSALLLSGLSRRFPSSILRPVSAVPYSTV